MKIINIKKEVAAIENYWQPHIAGELNGQHVKIAKVKGEFIWHHHAHEDELFYVIKGELEIHLQKEVLLLREHDMVIIPKGMEHKPVAKEEVWLLLFEPAETLNTGNIKNNITQEQLKRLDF